MVGFHLAMADSTTEALVKREREDAPGEHDHLSSSLAFAVGSRSLKYYRYGRIRIEIIKLFMERNASMLGLQNGAEPVENKKPRIDQSEGEDAIGSAVITANKTPAQAAAAVVSATPNGNKRDRELAEPAGRRPIGGILPRGV